jgi:beta-lactam-binding protein with PASTA domain
VGTDLENAKKWLMGQGVPEYLILVKQEYSTTVETDRVTRTEPAYGEEIKTGQTVTIWTSLGKEQVFARMPNVVGLDYEAAVEKLNEVGFMEVTSEEVDSMEPAGKVLEQSATRYMDTDVTTPIVLKISKGPAMKTMLNVLGKTYDDAEKALKDAGFLDVYPQEVESNEPAGTVVGQSVAADTEIAINAPITLEVSKGPKEVTMPDLTTKTFEAAEKILKDLGFTTVTRNDVENDAPAGEVVGQSVNKGDKVTVITEIVLDVSKGPKMATVPNVVGKTFEDAKTELELWGFKVVTRVDVENNAAAGLVVSQSVAKDTQVPVNTEIVLEVSLGPAAPVTTRKTITVDLSAVYTEPVETPYKFELRQGDQVPFVLQACDKAILEITLEGFSIQYYDIYLNDIYYETLRVDFDAE